ncbi:hypothetical protein D3C78_1859960 [compost metagenome]
MQIRSFMTLGSTVQVGLTSIVQPESTIVFLARIFASFCLASLSSRYLLREVPHVSLRGAILLL